MKIQGFTLIEVLITITILMIVSGLGVSALISFKKSAELAAVTDEIVSALEQAKSMSLSGKNGSSHGIKFSTSSYTTFIGDSYNSESSSNITREIQSGFTLSSNFGGSNDRVVFYRLTGLPSNAGSVTITQVSSSRTQVINISTQGSITDQ